MFCRRLHLAAICHAMLPEPASGEVSDESQPDRFRYMACVLPAMIAAFRRAGVQSEEIQVKLFGGAHVLRPDDPPDYDRGVGHSNVSMARLLLEKESLRIVASNAGGHRGRKVLFDTRTGQVFHKFLS
jgi:chemotaxis protein CheD